MSADLTQVLHQPCACRDGVSCHASRCAGTEAAGSFLALKAAASAAATAVSGPSSRRGRRRCRRAGRRDDASHTAQPAATGGRRRRRGGHSLWHSAHGGKVRGSWRQNPAEQQLQAAPHASAAARREQHGAQQCAVPLAVPRLHRLPGLPVAEGEFHRAACGHAISNEVSHA